jgi:hypothetical protein
VPLTKKATHAKPQLIDEIIPFHTHLNMKTLGMVTAKYVFKNIV